MKAAGPTAIKGYNTTPRFAKLRPVLKEWTAVIEEGVRAWEEPPYYYSTYERVNCGLLSVALWRKGVAALHEIMVDRRRSKEPGRADLDFMLGNTEYFIEAKMHWPNLAALRYAGPIADEIRARLDQAVNGAYAKYVFSPEDRWIAAVFVVPRIPKRTWAQTGEPARSLSEFVRAVQSKKLGADIVAWTLPRGLNGWRQSLGDQDTAYFPAVALIGKRTPTRRAR
jgi:hypothetical protein